MSYDVDLVDNYCAHCKRGENVLGTGGWNYTSNMAPAWCAAGADLAKFDGKPARDCAPVLGAAIDKMTAFPEFFATFDAPNGWGSMRTLVPALRQLLAAMEAHPDAIVEVRR